MKSLKTIALVLGATAALASAIVANIELFRRPTVKLVYTTTVTIPSVAPTVRPEFAPNTALNLEILARALATQVTSAHQCRRELAQSTVDDISASLYGLVNGVRETSTSVLQWQLIYFRQRRIVLSNAGTKRAERVRLEVMNADVVEVFDRREVKRYFNQTVIELPDLNPSTGMSINVWRKTDGEIEIVALTHAEGVALDVSNVNTVRSNYWNMLEWIQFILGIIFAMFAIYVSLFGFRGGLLEDKTLLVPRGDR